MLLSKHACSHPWAVSPSSISSHSFSPVEETLTMSPADLIGHPTIAEHRHFEPVSPMHDIVASSHSPVLTASPSYPWVHTPMIVNGAMSYLRQHPEQFRFSPPPIEYTSVPPTSYHPSRAAREELAFSAAQESIPAFHSNMNDGYSYRPVLYDGYENGQPFSNTTCLSHNLVYPPHPAYIQGGDGLIAYPIDAFTATSTATSLSGALVDSTSESTYVGTPTGSISHFSGSMCESPGDAFRAFPIPDAVDQSGEHDSAQNGSSRTQLRQQPTNELPSNLYRPPNISSPPSRAHETFIEPLLPTTIPKQETQDESIPELPQEIMHEVLSEWLGHSLADTVKRRARTAKSTISTSRKSPTGSKSTRRRSSTSMLLLKPKPSKCTPFVPSARQVTSSTSPSSHRHKAAVVEPTITVATTEAVSWSSLSEKPTAAPVINTRVRIRREGAPSTGRPSKACEFCRVRKIGCTSSSTNPSCCVQCVERKLSCVFPANALTKRIISSPTPSVNCDDRFQLEVDAVNPRQLRSSSRRQ